MRERREKRKTGGENARLLISHNGERDRDRDREVEERKSNRTGIRLESRRSDSSERVTLHRRRPPVPRSKMDGKVLRNQGPGSHWHQRLSQRHQAWKNLDCCVFLRYAAVLVSWFRHGMHCDPIPFLLSHSPSQFSFLQSSAPSFFLLSLLLPNLFPPATAATVAATSEL